MKTMRECSPEDFFSSGRNASVIAVVPKRFTLNISCMTARLVLVVPGSSPIILALLMRTSSLPNFARTAAEAAAMEGSEVRSTLMEESERVASSSSSAETAASPLVSDHEPMITCWS